MAGTAVAAFPFEVMHAMHADACPRASGSTALPLMTATEARAMNSFRGMQVVVMRPTIKRRTWKERLFSLPWRPWVSTRVVPAAIGPDGCYVADGKLFVGERFYDELRRATKPDRPAPGALARDTYRFSGHRAVGVRTPHREFRRDRRAQASAELGVRAQRFVLCRREERYTAALGEHRAGRGAQMERSSF